MGRRRSVSRESFSDTEAGEYHIQNILDIYLAGNPSDLIRSQPERFRLQLNLPAKSSYCIAQQHVRTREVFHVSASCWKNVAYIPDSSPRAALNLVKQECDTFSRTCRNPHSVKLYRTRQIAL